MAVADSIRETLIEAEHPMDPRDLIAIVADAYGHDETIEGLQVAIEHGRIALNGQGYVILVPTHWTHLPQPPSVLGKQDGEG